LHFHAGNVVKKSLNLDELLSRLEPPPLNINKLVAQITSYCDTASMYFEVAFGAEIRDIPLVVSDTVAKTRSGLDEDLYKLQRFPPPCLDGDPC